MNIKLFLSAALAATLSMTAVTSVLAEAVPDEQLQEKMQSVLKRFGQGDKKSVITDIGVDGLREVVVGGDIFYLTDDGKHLMVGNLLAIDNGIENLTEKTKAVIRKEAFALISDEETIIFGDDDAKHTLTVFTDVNCGFCKRFHAKMDDFNAAGIRVKYIFMPVITAASKEDAKSVWCADDRNQAMTDAKNGIKLSKAACETPIDKHMDIGRRLGVNATPMLFLADGSKFQGNWLKSTGEQLSTSLDALAKKTK